MTASLALALVALQAGARSSGAPVAPAPPSTMQATDDAGVPLELPLDRIPLEELSGADRAEAEAKLHVRLEEEYFLACDGNGNGWISFREGVGSLGMDRPEYFRFDRNKDGRISREEFGERYKASVENAGLFRPPTTHTQLFETPEGSPLLYDFNGTGALEVGEVNALIVDKGIAVPSAALFDMLDADRSGALEAAEFQDIIETLTPLMPREGEQALTELPAGGLPGFPRVGAEPVAPPKTADELFGERTPREEAIGTTRMPDLIVGPVSHFRRLDYDGDGWIEEADLIGLLRPANSEVRATAVLAAIDANKDGRLTPEELLASLGESPRR